MPPRVTNDYTRIPVAWFLGDEGDVMDWSQGEYPMPNEFNPKKCRLFLEYMQIGMTERQACLEVPVLESLIRSWRRGSNGAPPNFVEAYMQAVEQQVIAMAQETIDIADGTDRLATEYIIEAASEIKNPFRPNDEDDRPQIIRDALKALNQRAGERISTRRWFASKLLPNRFGDRLNLEHTGNAKKPVSVDVSKLTTEQLEKIAALNEELNGGKA